MDPKHVNLINENMHKLVESTCDLENVLERLVERKVLNHYMVKYIFNNHDRKKQNTAFYTMIKCRGPDAFDILIGVLRETGNEEPAKILERSKVSVLLTTSKPEMSNNISPAKEDFPDYCDVKDLVVKVHPDKKFMDIAENSPSGSKTYSMKSRPRGLALIINIFKCPDPERNREGSHLDADKVRKLFTEIGYKTICHTDLDGYDMKKEIKAFSMNKELLKVDSLVVFIMCHGKQYQDTDDVELAAADGSFVTTRWIISQFTDQNPSFVPFKDKPKLFFFQSCRLPSRSLKDKVTEKPANIQNTIMVFSTSTGTPSIRDVEKGTWFVAEFCRVVAENAFRYDLDTMLNMVEEAVGKKKDPCYGSQTMEVKKLGISGKIYFNPGL